MSDTVANEGTSDIGSRRWFGKAVLLGAPIVAASVLLDNTTASANAGDPWIAGGNASAVTDTLGTTNASSLLIVTGGTERMRVDGGDGRVGIGLTTPAANTQLHVRSTTKAFTARVDNSATNGVCVLANATGPGGRGVTGQAGGAGGAAIAGYGLASGAGSVGVYGEAQATNGRGVRGVAVFLGGEGVRGESKMANGVHGTSEAVSIAGVYGEGAPANGIGVQGDALGNGGIGVLANGPIGVQAVASNIGVYCLSTGAHGVFAAATGGASTGVRGEGTSCGVYGQTDGIGSAVWGNALGTGRSGRFSGGAGVVVIGNLDVAGNLTKSSGTFKIDHPQDPANKYLVHSFVESPEMMNVYAGVVFCDANGEAIVEMPSYFESLNRTFRYQLTCIGQPAVVYIAEKIRDGRFRIAGGAAGLEVSWQVTGVRQDVFAEANRVEVEPDKAEADRGMYLHPDLFGFGESRRIGASNTQLTTP
jgi:hypothetical protein